MTAMTLSLPREVVMAALSTLVKNGVAVLAQDHFYSDFLSLPLLPLSVSRHQEAKCRAQKQPVGQRCEG